MRKHILLVLTLLIFSNSTWAAWSDYKVASLSNLNPCEEDMRASTCVPTPENRFIIKGSYTGNFKSIDWKKYNAVLICIDILNVNKPLKKMLGLYGYEVEIKDGSATYWMPVQSSIVPYLKKEVKKGEVINLYVVRLGANKCNWVFFLNEFTKGSERLE